MAVTTFFHVHEVQEIVEPRGIEAVALLAEANLESLQRLTELPEGTPVGVVGWGRTCMENLSRSIEGAGLDHLRFVQVYVDEQTDEVLETLDKVEAVVCASITARRLRELGVPKTWRSSKKTVSWTRAASRCSAGCSASCPGLRFRTQNKAYAPKLRSAAPDTEAGPARQGPKISRYVR